MTTLRKVQKVLAMTLAVGALNTIIPLTALILHIDITYGYTLGTLLSGVLISEADYNS